MENYFIHRANDEHFQKASIKFQRKTGTIWIEEDITCCVKYLNLALYFSPFHFLAHSILSSEHPDIAVNFWYPEVRNLWPVWNNLNVSSPSPLVLLLTPCFSKSCSLLWCFNYLIYPIFIHSYWRCISVCCRTICAYVRGLELVERL